MADIKQAETNNNDQAIGFCVTRGLDKWAASRAENKIEKVLSEFPWLTSKTYKISDAELTLWGHGDDCEFLYQLNDGSKAVLVGSPTGDISFETVESYIKKWDAGKREDPVWDGRYLLIHISNCGTNWTMWNDWCGCIPVYHSGVGSGLIACSLETVVVEVCQFTTEDFCDLGIGSMLLNGHFLNDGTLYDRMKTLPPDHFGQWTTAKFHRHPLKTLQPSQKHWNRGWDELCDELYWLTHEAMKSSLKNMRAGQCR